MDKELYQAIKDGDLYTVSKTLCQISGGKDEATIKQSLAAVRETVDVVLMEAGIHGREVMGQSRRACGYLPRRPYVGGIKENGVAPQTGGLDPEGAEYDD